MEEVIKLIQQNGFWVFLVGVITSILIGAIKTPIRNKVITDDLSEEVRKKREDIFDTLVFLSTYIFSFIGALVYYTIINKSFNFVEILSLSLPVWLSQFMTYGIWKKFGLKRFLEMLLKLIIKDLNKDGKITLDEAIAQVKNAYKNGKLDIETLVKEATDNAEENFDQVVEEIGEDTEMTEGMEAVVEASKGDSTALVEDISEAAKDLAIEVKEAAKPAEETVTAPELVKVNEDVALAKGPAIKF